MANPTFTFGDQATATQPVVNNQLSLQPVTNQELMYSDVGTVSPTNLTIKTTNNSFGQTITNNSQQSNLFKTSQQDILFVDSTNKNSRVVLPPFNNEIVTSKSDNDLRDSLEETVGNIDNMAFSQQVELIDYVDINKPAVLNDNNVVMTYYDIFGTQYYKNGETLNVFSSKNNTYFALAAYVTSFTYINNDVNFDKNWTTYSIDEPFKVFRLYQDLQKSSYFVYAFEDIPNDQIVYNKYLGEVNWVNGVPMGNEIPKYENLVKTSTIDPDTLQTSSYLSSAKIKFDDKHNYNNGSYIGNVILKEIVIPEMELTKHDIKNERDEISYSYFISSVVIDNDLFKTDRQINGDLQITYSYSSGFIDYLSYCISTYSLYAKINIIREYVDYDYDNFKRIEINKVHVNPITLYIPTVVYTEIKDGYYQYIPYEKIEEESLDKISINLNIDSTNKSAIVTIDGSKFKWDNSGIRKVKSFDEDENPIEFEDIVINKIEDRNYIFVKSVQKDNKDKYSLYFKVNNLAQDEDLNFTEYDIDNALNIDEPENNIFHILVFTPGDIYVQKVTLDNDETKTIPLFNRPSIKINPVREFQLYGMSYMDYLNVMTTSYNIEYVTGIDNNYGWKYDPDVSSIRYVTDVLFERESLNVTYSYWSPKDNSYIPYTNGILEYDGNYYGSNIYDSTYIEDFLIENNKNDAEGVVADLKLIQVYKRTKLSGTDSRTPGETDTINRLTFKNSKSFIKDNEELKYKTYSNIPFELKNQSDLSFTGEYTFVPPEIGYIINQEESNDIVNVQNISKGIYVQKTINTYAYDDRYAAYYNVSYYEYDIEQPKYLDDKLYSVSLTGIKLSELKSLVNTASTNRMLNIENDSKSPKTLTLYTSYLFTDSLYKDKRIIRYRIDNGEYKTEKISILSALKCKSSNFDDLNHSFDFIFTNENKKYRFKFSPSYIYKNGFNNENIDEDIKKIFKRYIENEQDFPQNIYSNYLNKNDESKKENNTITYYYDIKDVSTIDVGNSYSISQVITTDGYWKPNYKEIIKPLTTVSYTFASNSIDISNAYIVPTTKNETLGFIHNPKITYNSFITSYVSEYKYTYVDNENIQCNYSEDETHKIFTVGDKYYGLTTKQGGKTPFFKYENNTLKYYNPDDSNDPTPYKDVTPAKFASFDKDIIRQYWGFISNKSFKVNIQNFIKGNEIKNDRVFNSEYSPKILIKNVNNNYYYLYFISKACHFYGGYLTDKYYACQIGTLESFTINRVVGDLVELHRRLCVSKSKSLQEIVYQEEEWVPQCAQIDTPFGIVNGKKVVVTDEVLVPATYTEVISIDPNTYEYFTKREILTEEHYAYTYEIEDIPLITTAYIYNNEDGIKIQGMDTLVEVLSGLRTGVDNNGNSYIIPSSLPNSSISSLSFDKLSKGINSYLVQLTYSLIHINSAIDRTNNNVGYVAYVISQQDNDNIGKTISDAIYKDSQDTIKANKTNVSNSINSQKSMFNRLTQSIDNQTSTLSKMMMISMIGNSSSYTTEGASLITNMLNSISGSVPQNWQSVQETGYQYTYQTLVNAYKATSYKHTKVIGRDLRSSSYVTRTGTYLYENPAYVTLTYAIYGDKYLNSSERIGLHLKKETRNFTYNGYVYREDYYSYQNIADILADLHISNRLPNRKEFIVDVSKRLYINSDFIFSYTSPNEYAVRAIRRADILWSELVKANVVEDSKSNQRPLPEIPNNRIYWWKNKLFLRQFATIFDLNYRKLLTLQESEFVKINSIIQSKIGTKLIPTKLYDTVYDFVITDSSKRPNISGTIVNAMSSKVTTTNRTKILANMFGVTYESMKDNPEVISEIRTLTSPYKSVLSLGEMENFEQLKIKV